MQRRTGKQPSGQKDQQKQQGVALITAILITAMVSIAAVAMSARQVLDIRRTSNIMHSDQAYLYALSVELASKVGLAFDDDAAIDHREEQWANEAFSLPVEGGNIAGTLIDLNGAFPINRVIDPATGVINTDYRDALIRLFTAVGLRTPDTAAAAVADWLDRDDTTSPAGFEDSDYLSLDKPHRTGNTEMASLSELKILLGFLKDEEGKDVDLLFPVGKEAFVNVLPNGTNPTMINVNTASAEVLMSLHPLITDTVAEAIISARAPSDSSTTGKTSSFLTGKDSGDIAAIIGKDYLNLNNTPPANNRNARPLQDFIKALSPFGLASTSEYFEVTAVAQIGSSELTVKSLLYRPTNAVTGKKPQLITTIRRGIGEY